MALTWRAVALAAFGVVPVLLVPVPGTAVLWALAVLGLCALDAALATSPRSIAVARSVPGSVRLTEQARSVLTLTNPTERRLRALVR
ncbi:MAG TPA: DUF58 domain-containing protein, partial [Pengzhenrongella sp.]